MNIKEAILNTFMVMSTHKMRSILTMLGIIIGISAVIVINSIGKGQVDLLDNIFSKLGNNLVQIKRNKNIKDEKVSYLFFYSKDVDEIKKNPNIKHVSADELSRIVITKPDKNHELKNKSTFFNAVSSSYFKMLNMEFVAGRPFSNKEKNEFAVIDYEFAKILYGSAEDALGKIISFHTKWYWGRIDSLIQSYTIVGVVKNPMMELYSFLRGGSTYMCVYLPVNVFSKVTGKDSYESISFEAVDGANLNNVSSMAIQQIAELERVPNNYYTYEKVNSFLSNTDKIVGKANLIVNLVSGISLFVGGIGVMVIMLVTVTERTREIGIRKSIGATKKDIMIQFLLESIILTLTGGVVGIIVGCVGSLIAGFFTSIPPAIDYRTIIFSVLITIAIGVIFGIYPAKKASELNPIDALRHE